MRINDIRAMRKRAPFRPFQIRLANGDVLSVSHPEIMSLPEDERDMFVIWTDKSWNLVDASQVVRLSTARKHKAGT
jgi:hypothetical protein